MAHNRAHARQIRTQRDVPEPAAFECRAQDVSRFRLGQSLAAVKVPEQGEIAEELGVLPLTSDVFPDPASIPGSVYDEPCRYLMLGAVIIGILYPAYSPVIL